MASLEQIRDGLAQTISNGVHSTIFTYSDVHDLTELPAVLIEPAEALFEEAMSRGTDCWIFNLFVVCNRVDGGLGQQQLDGFVSGCGPDSIREVLFGRSDLNLGDGTDATVLRMVGYGGSFDTVKTPLVGAVLKVRVYTDGRA